MKMVSILVVVSFFLISAVLGAEDHIKDVNNFNNFSKYVNSGTYYFRTTVYLDADIDFSGKSLDVIGKYSNYFLGTFDGQGHVISNLKIKSDSQYVGLFGYSTGLTIMNVVIDDTCSIESSYSSSYAYLGGILGHCQSTSSISIIENIVNMGNVTFSGNVGNSGLYFGGIAGYLRSSSNCYESYVKNCANYGAVTHSGTSRYSYIGGIVGDSSGDWPSEFVYIKNCLNYGTITDKAGDKFSLGGIVGDASDSKIENCVSGGLITGNSNSGSYVGSIVGGTDSKSKITNCFWTSDTGYSIAYNYSFGGDPTIDDETSQVTLDSTTLDKLNTYSSMNWLSNWTILHMNKAKISNANQDYLVVNNKYFPDAVGEGYTFEGWFVDPEFNDEYDPKSTDTLVDVYAKTTRYNYTITFNFNNGTIMNATYPYGDSVILPSNLIKEDCIFAFWVSENGDKISPTIFTVPARNVTLTVVWACTHISSVGDFIVFSAAVNSGVTNYSGSTIYLDSDIDLSDKSLDVIWKDTTKYFQGTFDGQGHIIRNLKIKSDSQYVGLFGYSTGLTIKNVVIDDTCSFESSYSNSNNNNNNAYLGGVIGRCESTSSNCNIENIVNMGNVTFSGSTRYLYFGGIAGYLKSSDSYTSTVKNCANYGFVTHSGGTYSHFSGIVGYSYGYSSSNSVYIQNCLNYGAITSSSTTNYLYLGGIVGKAYQYTKIENCVSGGIITENSNSESYVENIVGSIGFSSHINNCFWTSDVGYGNSRGSEVTINPDVLNELNAYSSTNGLSNWTMLYMNGARLNGINQYYLVINNRYFPDAVGEGYTFEGWFKDSDFNDEYDPRSIDTLVDAYAKITPYNYTITFDFNNGTIMNATYPYGDSVTFPSIPTRDHCDLLWINDYGKEVPSNSFTILARNATFTTVWACTHIASVDDFIDFSNNVNIGANYSGTTVYLDSDIDFSGMPLDVIGNTKSKYFQGTFDGQGHIISNLKIKSDSQYAGLFGFSKGSTIKNIVIDESCSVECSYSNSNGKAYLGGILGYCESTSSNCNIENIVNMGNVTYSGSTNKNIFVGGIVGVLYSPSSSKYNFIAKNCANYGSIAHSGTCGNYGEMGGIAGISEGYSSGYNYIQNCLNYGVITHSGISKYPTIGGIVGVSYSTKIQNCVNSGQVSMTGTSSYEESHIGSIVGDVSDSYTHINYCFWTSDTGYNNANGTGSPTIDSESSQVTLDSTSLNKLNTYSTTNGLNNWIFNKNNVPITFTMNNTNGFTLNSQIILLPSLANEVKLLYLWYKDSDFTTPFTGTIVESATKLYGRYGEKNFTITFNFNNGTTMNAKYLYGDSVILPSNLIKEDCIFAFWVNEYGDNVSNSFTVPARNVTLTAVWMCTHISSVDDFIDFARIVNSDISYSGTTLVLDTDIDLSGKSLDVIGKDSSNYFQGTFDGQGHIISNLKIKSDSQYVGLFEFSRGVTIKNVVFDDTCSVESSYSSSGNNIHANVGGIIGCCYAYSSNCNIENIVNMGNVTFSGSAKYLYFGGIVGRIYSPENYNSFVKNCANYGTVTHSGFVSEESYIGGIVGLSEGYSSSKFAYIQNCLNYGAITGKAGDKFSLGGIVGEAYRYSKIENCVSGGLITGNSNSGSYTGSIVGYTYSNTYINSSFWTSDTGYSNANGGGSPTIDDETSQVTLDSTTLDKLKTYSSTNGLSNWAMLHLNGGKISDINQDYLVVNNKYFPDPEKDGLEFGGWYKDPEFNEEYDSKSFDTLVDAYAKFGVSHIVTFDFNNGTTVKVKCFLNENVVFPENTYREGYTFGGWFTNSACTTPFDNGAITKDITLYAKYDVINFTVTFDFSNGTKINVPCLYNEKVVYSGNTNREGYTFEGWFTDSTCITPFDNGAIIKDITLYAKYEEIKRIVESSSSNNERGNEKKESYESGEESETSLSQGNAFSFSIEIIPLSMLVSFLLLI